MLLGSRQDPHIITLSGIQNLNIICPVFIFACVDTCTLFLNWGHFYMVLMVLGSPLAFVHPYLFKHIARYDNECWVMCNL